MVAEQDETKGFFAILTLILIVFLALGKGLSYTVFKELLKIILKSSKIRSFNFLVEIVFHFCILKEKLHYLWFSKVMALNSVRTM